MHKRGAALIALEIKLKLKSSKIISNREGLSLLTSKCCTFKEEWKQKENKMGYLGKEPPIAYQKQNVLLRF